MPLFKYRAVDQYGEPMEGTMEEDSAERVTLILQERGAQVNHVEEIGEAPTLARGTSRLRWEDLALLNDQCSRLSAAEFRWRRRSRRWRRISTTVT